MAAKVFDPDGPAELIRGWALHAVKARRKHEKAARKLDQKRYLIGILAIIASAIVGASVIASLEARFGVWVTITVGLGSIVASVLTSLQTFLGYAERAERHRAAGVEYKAVIRALEEKMALPSGVLSLENVELGAWLDDMRCRLDGLERKTPIVPDQIDRDVEGEQFPFVRSADELHR